jgi:ATP-dependent helicase/nuclease subunit A
MQPNLFDPIEPIDSPGPSAPPDQAARDFAIDPAEHVVLEASAGTGKTRVLVDRYVRLIRDGVPPRHILAITFTRKAAAEMRERILSQLRDTEPAATLAEIQIATIDAFCFGLLREFPLEADVDPGFEIADETEMARFAAEALEVTLRIARGLVTRQEPLRLLFTRVKPRTLRIALARLLDSRHIAEPAIAMFVKQKVARRSADDVAAAFVSKIRAACEGQPALITDGPIGAPEFRWVAEDLARLAEGRDIPVADVPQLVRRLERYFLTLLGKPRKRLPGFAKAEHFANSPSKKRHEAAFGAVTPAIADAIDALERDVDGLLALGLQTLLAIVVREYQRLLDEHSVLDFAGMLDRAVLLLSRQEEFARSRLKLQSRYHHLLVDEFQDTSRQQWRLIDLLVEAWGEGEGVVDGPTSIFIVGDRKQSIYRFRHAEVVLLDEAARRISALRPGRRVRQAISTNFRAVPGLLAFVNALASSMEGDPELDERFVYRDSDRFPVDAVTDGARRDGEPVLGVVAQPSIQGAAEAVAAEIARILADVTVRDKVGPPRQATADDIAILFRARAGHQVFEDALERRGIRTYVYKGLGFFDAPEVQDLQALLRFLSQPDSDLRAAEFLRSRFVRLSDVALARLAPHLAAVLTGMRPVPAGLDEPDARLLAAAVRDVPRWIAMADRIPAGALIDAVMRESAYASELRGRSRDQSRENIKKVRSLIRRVENRGYATLGRLAEYFETLRAGDESNAVVEARGCVQLMTIHAAKGLEFPVVFVVNLQNPGRGRHQGISVINRSVDGEPEVAFRPTDGTRLEEKRETEELRRLLYVAVTRARDRLYLAAQVDEHGYLGHAARSLAGLFPATLREVFPAAANADAEAGEVFWEAPGQRFAFRVCRPGPAQPEDAGGLSGPDRTRALDRQPLVWAGGIRQATTHDWPATSGDVVPMPAGEAVPDSDRSRTEDRIAGTLVHRLLQWAGSRRPTVGEWTDAFARLVRPEALVDVRDPETLRRTVVAAADALRTRTRLADLLAGGTCWYETPFSWRMTGTPEVVVRGTIDCLVVDDNGAMTVVEIKTGAPRPEHQVQLDTYLAALRELHSDVPIRGELVYGPPGE